MSPIELATEVALLVMRNGGSTVAAERNFNIILAGYGQSGVAAIWRLDFLAVFQTAGGQSSIVVRAVGPIGVNLARASAAAVLSEQVAAGGVDLAELDAEIERIKQLASPYNRWLVALAAAGIGGAFTQCVGGDLGSLYIALVAAGIGQILRSQLQSRQVPVAIVTAASGTLSALIASVALRLGYGQVVPLTMFAAVVYLVPGLPLINGFVDLLSQRHLLIGAERIINAMYLFLVLAISIAVASAILR